jgi:uncharacterized protein (DUF58 family)
MYLGLLLVVLAVLFVIVGIFSGGVFTIVLVPLAVVAVVAAVVALLTARAAGISATLTKEPERQSPELVPRDAGPAAGDVPATPDDYVEARQKYQ